MNIQSDSKNKKVLITGGAGYIGSRLSLLLDKKGYKVVVADRVLPEEMGIKFPASINFKKGDLKDPVFAKEVVRGIDTIIHLAAKIGSLTYMRDHQAEILQENCMIDANLYPCAVKAGVKRIIYSSSSMVFQQSPKYPYTEKDLPNIPPPANVYGLSKLVGEYFCRSYYNQFKLPYVIIRYHNIYGPGERSKGQNPGDIHVIPALIKKVESGQYPLEIIGNPNSTRPFTYIDDAVQATFMIFERAVEDDKNVINNDFNIGPKHAIKIIDLAKIIWDIFGDGRPFKYTVKETTADTADHRELNPGKIEKTIGWSAKTDIRKGILKIIKLIKEKNT